MTGNSHLLWTYNWVKVSTVTLKWAAAVSRGIPRICRGETRNLANGTAEFGKICRNKLWSLIMTALSNKHYSGYRKAIQEDGKLETLGKKDLIFKDRNVDGRFNAWLEEDKQRQHQTELHEDKWSVAYAPRHKSSSKSMSSHANINIHLHLHTLWINNNHWNSRSGK